MRAERFRFLLIAWIDGDKSVAFKLIDNEVIEVTLIVSGISDKESALFKAINAFELLNEPACYFGIGNVVGKSGRDKRNTFFGNNDMSTVAPEKFKGFSSICFFQIAVVTQRSLGVTVRFFFFVGYYLI